MNLDTFAARHRAAVCDWTDTWDIAAAERGWKYLAVFTNPDEMEPDMLLLKSPRWPNYQVRDIYSGIPSGTMLTEKQVKQWIKAKAA